MGLGKYLKKAFLNHWNLLVFLGASGFALLSGHPDVYIPLVLAGEAAYVGVVGTHPKFQRHVDSQETRRNRAQGSVLAAEAFQRVVKSLPPRQLRRFEALRELKIEPSDRPSKEMQRQPRFQDTVYYLRDLISQLEESQRAGT